MKLSDLFDIKFKNHTKHGKVILFLVGKIARFDVDMEQIKELIKEYLELIKEYNELSICIDIRSFESANLKSVWEGISECTYYDHIIAKSIKQECIVINNRLSITIIDRVLKVHKPIFRFKMTDNLKEGVDFLGEGMGNGYKK